MSKFAIFITVTVTLLKDTKWYGKKLNRPLDFFNYTLNLKSIISPSFTI